MAHAIEVFFDDHADSAVRGLWLRMASADLPSLATRSHRRHRPHVTLAVTRSLARADLEPVRAALAGEDPVLLLPALGIFPGGVLFLGAVVTGDLLALHARVHRALADQPVTHSPYYLPGQWTPHCTLAQDLTGSQLAAAIQLLHRYRPITARITSAGVFDTSTGTIQSLTGEP